MDQEQKNTILERHERVGQLLVLSGAPRFLAPLFTLPPGEHLIEIDHPEIEEDEREAWIYVYDTDDRGRTARLMFFSSFREANEKGHDMPTVYHHYEVRDDHLWASKSLEETPPENHQGMFGLAGIDNLTGSDMVIEDICEFCGLPYDEKLAGVAPPEPKESAPPFDGVLPAD